MPDILLEIPRDEENNLENISNNNRLWKFVKSKKLSEIKKKLILWDAKWSDDQSFRIKDRDELILEDFECESIDEWLNYKNTPRPELPSENEIPLALNVELRWRILPPYLPIEAKKHKLEVALIDRDIQITLRRFSKNFKFKELIKIIFSVFKKSPKKQKIDLKKVPTDELIEFALSELKNNFPSMYKVLVHERDIYMARKLVALSLIYPNKKILAVVGAGHVKGMSNQIEKILNSK